MHQYLMCTELTQQMGTLQLTVFSKDDLCRRMKYKVIHSYIHLSYKSILSFIITKISAICKNIYFTHIVDFPLLGGVK